MYPWSTAESHSTVGVPVEYPVSTLAQAKAAALLESEEQVHVAVAKADRAAAALADAEASLAEYRSSPEVPSEYREYPVSTHRVPIEYPVSTS